MGLEWNQDRRRYRGTKSPGWLQFPGWSSQISKSCDSRSGQGDQNIKENMDATLETPGAGLSSGLCLCPCPPPTSTLFLEAALGIPAPGPLSCAFTSTHTGSLNFFFHLCTGAGARVSLHVWRSEGIKLRLPGLWGPYLLSHLVTLPPIYCYYLPLNSKSKLSREGVMCLLEGGLGQPCLPVFTKFKNRLPPRE